MMKQLPSERQFYVSALLSGGLLGVAFLHPWLNLLWLPGVVVFLRGLTQLEGKYQAFFYGWMVGTLKAAGAVAWYWTVYPLEQFGFTGWGQLFLIGLYWQSTALAIGAGVGLAAFLMVMFRRWYLWPVWWLVGEWAGSVIFSIYSLGPGSGPNGYFSFGYTGYLLVDIPGALTVASLTGVYGLSVVVMLVGYGLYAFVYGRHSQAVMVVGLVGCLFSISFFTMSERTTVPADLTLAAIDTSFTGHQHTYTERWDSMNAGLSALGAQAPDMVLLPEDSRWDNQFSTPEGGLHQLADWFEEPVVVLDSARTTIAGDTTVLRATAFDTGAGQWHQVDKQYLVPQGEFIPYWTNALLYTVAPPAVARQIEKDITYRPGPLTQYGNAPSYIPPVLFCMESTAPTAIRRLQSAGRVPLVVHPVSHGWFHEPTQLWYMLDRMLQVQAVWSNVSVLSAGNQSIGKLYRSDGTINPGSVVAEGERWRAKVW